jgi:hypothetical protein
MRHSVKSRMPSPVGPQAPFAPYAPVRSVRQAIAYERSRGFSEPLDRSQLERAGVAPSMTARTLQALRFLDFVDADGASTDSFRAIALASSAEVSAAIRAAAVRAYSVAFGKAVPLELTDPVISDLFRGFRPAAQRPRMAALFRALVVEMNDVGDAEAPKRVPRTMNSRGGAFGEDFSAVHPALRALLQSLPVEGRWTRLQRDRWLVAWSATLDMAVAVTD